MDEQGHDPATEEVADTSVEDAIARILIAWLIKRNYISGVTQDGSGQYVECYVDRDVWPDG